MGKAYSDVGVRVYLKNVNDARFISAICPTAIPDMGAPPETLDSTDMCDDRGATIQGRESLSEMAFTFWYTGEKMDLLKPYTNTDTELVIVLPDSRGYHFIGSGSVYVSGFGVNEVIPATYTFYPIWRSADLLTKDEINELVTQTVTITPIINRTVQVGKYTSVPVNTIPIGATIDASSSDDSIVEVEVSGRSLEVSGVSTGEAMIYVSASTPDFADGITEFKVTVEPAS